MYCDFYDLREKPFNVTADPRFLYLNSRYREALASLHYGITQRKGFVTLIGEAGTGKTTLLKKLLDDLDSTTRTVFIFNTNVSFDEILEYTFSELDLPVHNGKRLYMLQRLNSYLLDELREGRNVALLIDEAQDLDYAVLEDLRLLSNLETATEKILQIVLSGQPELADKLGNSRLRQLRQRISVNCRLLPLTREELTEYIHSRLVAAGSSDPKLFSRDAEDRIFEISGGIPRVVNVLCDNTLVIGYALGKKRLTAEVIQEAAADLLPVESTPDPDARRASLEPKAEPEPSTDAAPARRFSQSAIIITVLVAIVIGLLSVGRTLIRNDSTGVVVVSGRESSGPEVIQPGARPPFREPDVIEPGGGAGERWPVVQPPPAARPVARQVTNPATADAARDQGEMIGATTIPARQDPPKDVPVDSRIDASDVRITGDTDSAAPVKALAAIPRPVTTREQPPAPLGRADVAPPLAPAQAEPEAPQVAMHVPALDQVVPVPGAAPAVEVNEPETRQDGGDRMRVAVSRFGRVRIESGDSFSAIAVRNYGQANDTVLDVMKLANPAIRNVDVISLGQELRLPQFDEGFLFLQDQDDEYSLLLMSTPMRGRANEMAASLRLRGFDARVAEASLSPRRPIWRVVVGGYAGREAAQSDGRRLRQLFREDSRLAAMAR